MPQCDYKFYCYPTATQQRRLAQYFGTTRWMWIKCLDRWQHWYQVLEASVTAVDFSRELTQVMKALEPYRWLNGTPTTDITQFLRDQDRAIRSFFKQEACYPKPKRRHGIQSIRMQLDQRIVANLYRPVQRLKVPGLGSFKLVWSRVPQRIPKRVMIKRVLNGRYRISKAVEELVDFLPATSNTVGIDVGTRVFPFLGDGTVIPIPRLQRQTQVYHPCSGSYALLTNFT